jgi:hypothetical protein
MPDLSDDAGQMRNQLQLTVLSAEILKRELDKVHDISISCNISELPNYHCNLVFQQKQQDIGPIGFLQFDAKRPLVNAVINLGEKNFLDFLELLKYSPPRHASIFLFTDSYNEEFLLSRSFTQPGISVDIRDISWRYPLI